MTYLIHLECPQCKQLFSASTVQTYCHDCQSPILARYDLSSAKRNLNRDDYCANYQRMWRWHDLLPVENLRRISSLGEGDTPLIRLNRVGNAPGLKRVWIKDEGLNPTASFKARGLSSAVSKANELGLKQLVIPTAGNAGSALAAYSSRVKIKSAAVMPFDTPPTIINECRMYGAEVSLVNGSIADCARIVDDMVEGGEWFSVSTFREPYRLEGKKTMGYEIAEAFGWHLPDNIIYPTGGGTGLVGMWKAFEELQELDWLEGNQLPRMISVQSTGCAPVVQAFNSGVDTCEFWRDAETIASGIRVPHSLADRLILKILRKSGGTAIAVRDEQILWAQSKLAKEEGLFCSPEGAATYAAYQELISDGWITPDETTVLFSTASGVKYI
ncbi:MAG: threonine synthase [Anaerolineales bacterium]